MPDRYTILGHPLAAPENRLAFVDWPESHLDLIAPETWRSPSLAHDYRNVSVVGDARTPSLSALPVGLTGSNSLFWWKGLSGHLRRHPPDVMYCWEEPWCVSTLQAAFQAGDLGAPLVFYSAENKPKRLPWPFRKIRDFVYARSRAAITPTKAIADTLRASGFAGDIRVVPLWIAPRKFLEVNPDGKCLAYLGRLIPLKRVDLIIQALAHLPGYRLRLIGDGPERERLGALSHALGLDDRVEFHGHVDNAELEPALRGASLLVLPTGENARQAEQFGKAVLEGVACGLPVLASRGGNLELLSRSIPTVVARDLDSPALMAAAIEEMYSLYPDTRRRTEARVSVLRNYGPEPAGRALAAAFAEFAQERKIK